MTADRSLQEQVRERVQLRALRAMLLALLAFSIVGTGIELVLLEHYESTAQWVPLVSFAAGLAVTVAVTIAPGRITIRTLQIVMLGFIAAGAAGLYFHYTGNVEFAKETYPSLKGRGLAWEALTGATPALAPGTMVQIGLLGLAAVFRHPALQGRTDGDAHGKAGRAETHATLDNRPT